MGERAQKILIKTNAVMRYYSQWGGQTCYACLLEGEDGLNRDLQDSKQYSWVIPEFAEGGYLIDFDMKTILLYSWDRKHLSQTMPEIQSYWSNWTVREVVDGVPDFRVYVRERGVII